jgi:hypothetical protein
VAAAERAEMARRMLVFNFMVARIYDHICSFDKQIVLNFPHIYDFICDFLFVWIINLCLAN